MTSKTVNKIKHAWETAKDKAQEAVGYHPTTTADRVADAIEHRVDSGIKQARELADSVLGKTESAQAHEFFRDLKSDLKDLVVDGKNMFDSAKKDEDESELGGILGRIQEAWNNLFGE